MPPTACRWLCELRQPLHAKAPVVAAADHRTLDHGSEDPLLAAMGKRPVVCGSHDWSLCSVQRDEPEVKPAAHRVTHGAKHARRVLRPTLARPACDSVRVADLSGAPIDRRVSIHTTCRAVNRTSFPKSASRRGLASSEAFQRVRRSICTLGGPRVVHGATRKPKSTFWALEKRSPNVLPPHLDFCENRVGASLAA